MVLVALVMCTVHFTLLRRRSEASVLDDLEVFMAMEVEEGAKVAGFARSWCPGLGRPTLVVPAFNMAVYLHLQTNAAGIEAERYEYPQHGTINTPKYIYRLCLLKRHSRMPVQLWINSFG